MRNVIALLISFLMACSMVSPIEKKVVEFFEEKNDEKILELIESGEISLEYQTSGQGFSLLHLCVFYHNTSLLEAFIERGVPLDVVDKNGNTSLVLAIERDEEDMARVLIEDQADPNIANRRGDTALIMTTKKKMHSLLRSLTEGTDNRVDPFLKDSKGKRALEYLPVNSPSYILLRAYEERFKKRFPIQ